MEMLNPERLSKLRIWYNDFNENERKTFQDLFGFLESLLAVEVSQGLIEGVSSFWVPDWSVFRFGSCELTPTMDEYSAILRVPFDGCEIPNSKFPRGYRGFLSSFFMIKKKHLTNINPHDANATVDIDFLVDRFMNFEAFSSHENEFLGKEDGWRKRRVQTLGFCLFGCILFPRSDGLLDARLAYIVKQVEDGCTFIPMVVAETYRCLTRLKNSLSTHFGACTQLLQLWLIPHVYHRRLREYVFLSTDPIPCMIQYQNALELPSSCDDWVSLLWCCSPSVIRWYLGLTSLSTNVRVRTRTRGFIPLVGLGGIVPYFGVRVLRQFGHRQVVPVMDDATDFHIEFDGQIDDIETNILKKAIDAWNERVSCNPQESDVSTEPKSDPEYNVWITLQITNEDHMSEDHPNTSRKRICLPEAEYADRVKASYLRERKLHEKYKSFVEENQDIEAHLARFKSDALEVSRDLEETISHLQDALTIRDDTICRLTCERDAAQGALHELAQQFNTIVSENNDDCTTLHNFKQLASKMSNILKNH